MEKHALSHESDSPVTSIGLTGQNLFQASYAEFIAEAQATASRRKLVFKPFTRNFV